MSSFCTSNSVLKLPTVDFHFLYSHSHPHKEEYHSSELPKQNHHANSSSSSSTSTFSPLSQYHKGRDPRMGKSPDSSPDSSPKTKKNPKNDVVTAKDQKYNQTQPMYPPPPPPAPPYNPSESPAPSSSNYQQYPNPYAAPSPYNQYATSSPYQPYPPPYHGAPPPYPQAPPAAAYNEYYYQQHLRHESNVAASFGRILLILMLILLSSILMMSLIMWILFGASVPEFEVGSVRVSDFTATNTSLTGAWGVQMWVSNVNMELDVHFDHAMSSIFYKESLVAAGALQPFDVRKTQRFGLNFSVPALQDQKWISPELAGDRSDGVVVVSLRLAVDTNFTSPDVVYKADRLSIMCEDLPISFPSASGEGTLAPSFVKNYCFIRLRDGHD